MNREDYIGRFTTLIQANPPRQITESSQNPDLSSSDIPEPIFSTIQHAIRRAHKKHPGYRLDEWVEMMATSKGVTHVNELVERGQSFLTEEMEMELMPAKKLFMACLISFVKSRWSL
jgi:hypothetical protein